MNVQTSDKLAFINKLRESMPENRFMLSYRGDMTDDIMMPLLAMTEKKLDQSGSAGKIKAKVFNVMVECLQNVTRHAADVSADKAAMFMFGASDEGYVIFSGNAIKNENVHDLKNKLLKINTMSKEELKEFYKLWINSQEFSEKGGAGLGLIDMARKTGNPLEFDFEPIDDEYYFFSLKTVISIN